MAIVIVEGVDGSGKTTLLRNLREVSPTYFLIASSSGRAKTLKEMEEAIFWIGQCSYLKLPVLCDRFPLISEAVYGPVIRGKSILWSGRDSMKYIDWIPDNVKRIIYCRPPTEVIQDNLGKNSQMAGVSAHLNRLISCYDELLAHYAEKIEVVKYDYTQPHEYDIHEMVFGEKRG